MWLLLGARERIPEPVVASLEDPGVSVMVSAVSAWEIAIKRSLGKLTIGERWLPALGALGFGSMPITALQAAAVENLPWHHRDPFDRMIIATALAEKIPVIGADRQFSAYRGLRQIW